MSDLRERLAVVLDGIEDDAVRELVAEVFTGTKKQSVWHTFECRECDQKQRLEVEVEVPAAKFAERVKALQMLLDQGKGRPAERKVQTIDVTVRHLGELRELSDEQLAAIASGVAEVAEWEPLGLPPAA